MILDEVAVFWLPTASVAALAVFGFLALARQPWRPSRKYWLAAMLLAGGLAVGGGVLAQAAGPEYDKQIDSQFADMKNTGSRHGGSITAAQFLQRFVDDTPWAHLDIAGTAMGAPKTEINHSWGSGYGVRLLERLVAEYSQSFNAPLALLAEVPLLKAKNRTDEARRVCETLLTQYRDSVLANEAMRELRALPKAAQPNRGAANSLIPRAGMNPPPLLARPPEAPAASVAPAASSSPPKP